MGGWFDFFWNACANGTTICPGTASRTSPSPITPSLDGQFPLALIGAPLSAPSVHRDSEAFLSEALDLHLSQRHNLIAGGDYRYQQNFSYQGGLVRGLVVSNNIGEFTSDSETCISCGAGIAFQHPSQLLLSQPLCPADPLQPQSTPAACLGNSGRNAFTGPAFFSQDLPCSALKVAEGQTLVLRGEAYNLFNRSNFYNPISELSTDGVHLNPEFSLVRSAHNPRQFQFAARYEF